jgi:hypothetical protein
MLAGSAGRVCAIAHEAALYARRRAGNVRCRTDSREVGA